MLARSPQAVVFLLALPRDEIGALSSQVLPVETTVERRVFSGRGKPISFTPLPPVISWKLGQAGQGEGRVLWEYVMGLFCNALKVRW